MTTVTSLEQFSKTVSDFRKSHGKVLTNCFLMPDEIASLVSEGRISLKEDGGWLFLVVDNYDYRALYYYTEKDAPLDAVERFVHSLGENSLIIDITLRGKTGDSETLERLVDAGLAERYKKYIRLFRPFTEDNVVEDVDFREGYHAVTTGVDPKAVVALWKKELDEKSTPLPRECEIQSLIENGDLICVVDDNGDLSAVMMNTISRKQQMLWHLVVSENHRRKGLAVALYIKCLVRAQKAGASISRSLIDVNNIPSLTLAERLGFEPDGLICEQLYMKGM